MARVTTLAEAPVAKKTDLSPAEQFSCQDSWEDYIK